MILSQTIEAIREAQDWQETFTLSNQEMLLLLVLSYQELLGKAAAKLGECSEKEFYDSVWHLLKKGGQNA